MNFVKTRYRDISLTPLAVSTDKTQSPVNIFLFLSRKFRLSSDPLGGEEESLSADKRDFNFQINIILHFIDLHYFDIHKSI